MTTPSREASPSPVPPASLLSERTLLVRLLLVSIAALYLEIVLIRWISTEVRVFAYVQNLALIVCFLGFGIGCFGARNRTSLLPTLIAITALIAVIQMPFAPWQAILTSLSAYLTIGQDAALWGGSSGMEHGASLQLVIASVGVLTGMLMLLVIAMVPLGQWVGHYFSSARHVVRAYTVNLVGSVAGLWLLALLSYYWLPPVLWFVIAFALIVLAQPMTLRQTLVGAALLGACFLFLRPSPSVWEEWSPYQKLTILPLEGDQFQIMVNETGYMSVANGTPAYVGTVPELAQGLQDTSYDSPFRFIEKKDRVLIVGAGAGNDAAAALRNGAGEVDAVEIDPVIFSLGERLHPEHPYQSQRVRKITNDARNFMRQSRDQYDVIVFGLLDSHTEFSHYSNVRMDNYVYTEEAFRDARRLLKPGGVLVMKFEVRRPWLWMGQRLYVMLDRIFERPPVVYVAKTYAGFLSATVFLESDSPEFWKRAAEPPMVSFLQDRQPKFPRSIIDAPPTPTDDWPYMYHQGRFIPRTYLLISLVVLAMAIFLVREFFKPREAGTWHFFFLGAGFLLLETQLISRLALYFGTTWIVTSIAITALLFVLVLANLHVERSGMIELRPYFAGLIISLLINYAIYWRLVPLPPAVVGSLLGLATSVPVFFAGVIFAESLRRAPQRTDAFGANIIGSVAGGVAHNLSFIIGMKALLLVAVVFYAGSAVFYRKSAARSLLPAA